MPNATCLCRSKLPFDFHFHTPESSVDGIPLASINAISLSKIEGAVLRAIRAARLSGAILTLPQPSRESHLVYRLNAVLLQLRLPFPVVQLCNPEEVMATVIISENFLHLALCMVHGL